MKKRKKHAAKGKLSFGVDDEEGGDTGIDVDTSAIPISEVSSPGTLSQSAAAVFSASKRHPLGPSPALPLAPLALTKSALLREAETREHLRRDFLTMQEAVKATEILIPFVFYDGTNTPGGACNVKKGDFVWVFMDRSPCRCKWKTIHFLDDPAKAYIMVSRLNKDHCLLFITFN